jgi:hypothetical protein
MSVVGDSRRSKDVTTGLYGFEIIKHTSCLGTVLNSENLIKEEINNCIMSGNRAYFARVKLLNSTILSRHSKVKLYRTLIRPIVTYGSETWTMSAADENALRIFERKILRRIYGPVSEGDTWRIRTNGELEDILSDEDIVRFVKSRKLAWLGNVEKMAVERMLRKMLHGRMKGKRRSGRPRKRWI